MGGTNQNGGSVNLIRGIIFAENYMKIEKKMDSGPLDPPLEFLMVLSQYKNADMFIILV